MDNIDIEKYHKGAMALNEGNVIILVEGASNKLFYSKFNEIKHIAIFRPLDLDKGSNSCINIKSLIKENDGWCAILDKDFQDYTQDRIFNLDYYSLENVVLCHHKKFNELYRDISSLIEKNVGDYRNKRLTIKVLDEGKRSEIIILSETHLQFSDYVEKTIVDSVSYLKYMDVKKIVEVFDSLLTTKISGHKKRKYFEELYDELNDKSLLNLFHNSVHHKLRELFPSDSEGIHTSTY